MMAQVATFIDGIYTRALQFSRYKDKRENHLAVYL